MQTYIPLIIFTYHLLFPIGLVNKKQSKTEMTQISVSNTPQQQITKLPA